MGVGGYDCSKHIYGWVYLFRIHLLEDAAGCDCLKPIYGWVYLFRVHLWVGVGVLSV